MKKIKHVAVSVLLSFILSGFFIGCNQGMDDEILPEDNPIEEVDEENDNEDEDEDNDNDDDNDEDNDDKVTFQSQLDSAQAGSTVTLNNANTGSSITISKGLTVDGNGIENLTVIINSEVASNVSLKNFVNATITISETNRSARNSRAITNSRNAAPEPTPSKPREIGDDNPKLYIENCSFDKIIAEEDVSIYMKEDTLKSRIKEIELKNSVESFVVIEDESENLEKDKKSAIDKITIEKGVDEVELLGGYYKDIEFKGEFAANDKVDFYYDEKGNQVESAFRSYLAEQSAKVNAKDICNVKNGNGIYKFTIPTSEVNNLNDGKFTIALIKDTQKAKFLASDQSQGPSWPWASVEEPYFEISYTGLYKYDVSDTDVHAICGVATSNYFGATNTTDYYEFYGNYSKEGICSQKTAAGDVVIYLNLSKLVKSDLATCAFAADGRNDEYYCQPRKLTEIDLDGYKPYIAIHANRYDEQMGDITPLKSYYTFENDETLLFPASKSNGSLGGLYGYFTSMDSVTTYPDVSNVQLNIWKCADMVEVYEIYTTGGQGLTHRMPLEKFRDDVIYNNSNNNPQLLSEYDLFLDEACTTLIWEQNYSGIVDKIYAKPVQKITGYIWGETNEYSRREFWYSTWNGASNIPKMAVFTQQNPNVQDLTDNPSIRITNISQFVPGETYYYCQDPQ